jgi:uncharacterized protein YndB with AHSA1/START domain
VDVTRELTLPESPDEVWEALTDPERLEEWFANEVELEVEEGGEGVFRWDDGEVRRARVDEVEPGRRFAFTWGEGEDESVVTFTLEEVPDGTRLVVTETVACGWATALELRAAALAYA